MLNDDRAQSAVVTGLFTDPHLDKVVHDPVKYRTLLRYQLRPPVDISNRLFARRG